MVTLHACSLSPNVVFQSKHVFDFVDKDKIAPCHTIYPEIFRCHMTFLDRAPYVCPNIPNDGEWANAGLRSVRCVVGGSAHFNDVLKRYM